MRSNEQGFTILELTAVVAVLAIVSVFATNQYSDYVERARLARTKVEIAHIATQIEKFATSPSNPTSALPSSLADLGLPAQVTTDPWGNAYQYQELGELEGVGGARKDHNNVQLNTDYDLYSFGKDGETNQTFTSKLSIDDIVRGTNGSFIGTPAEYARLPSDY